MTKSLLSTLVGRRVSEGKMSLNQLVKFSNHSFSEYGLTIWHLLNMTSGLDWIENYGPSGDPTKMLFTAPDMAAFVSQRKQVSQKKSFAFFVCCELFWSQKKGSRCG
jgi:CubicO group peptidase (beta-lactamase class C family)